jgi:hypothetical protein
MLSSVLVVETVDTTKSIGVMVIGATAYDGYTALPVASWGKAYVVATPCHGHQAKCQIVIVTKPAATVSVR